MKMKFYFGLEVRERSTLSHFPFLVFHQTPGCHASLYFLHFMKKKECMHCLMDLSHRTKNWAAASGLCWLIAKIVRNPTLLAPVAFSYPLWGLPAFLLFPMAPIAINAIASHLFFIFLRRVEVWGLIRYKFCSRLTPRSTWGITNSTHRMRRHILLSILTWCLK